MYEKEKNADCCSLQHIKMYVVHFMHTECDTVRFIYYFGMITVVCCVGKYECICYTGLHQVRSNTEGFPDSLYFIGIVKRNVVVVSLCMCVCMSVFNRFYACVRVLMLCCVYAMYVNSGSNKFFFISN